MTIRLASLLSTVAIAALASTSAQAVPQFRLLLSDNAGSPAGTTAYYFNVGSTPTSTGPIAFDGYTFNVNLNSNFPGTSTVGTLSQSFTFSGSLNGANRDFTSVVTIVDSNAQNTQLKFTLPDISGTGYQLTSDSSNTTNASLSSGATQVASQANNVLAFNNVNNFSTNGGTPTATAAVPPDATGYYLTNAIDFTGIVANGPAGLSSITASATSSVQAVPADTALVPEPASLALLGLGLFGAGMVRRRAK